MSDGDILFTFLALLFVGWVCYGVGKRVGIAKMRKAEKLSDTARGQTDREKKAPGRKPGNSSLNRED